MKVVVVMVTVKAVTLCGSVVDSIAVCIVVVVLNTVAWTVAVATLRAGVIAAAIFGSEILVGLERIGVNSDGVGVVVTSFDFFCSYGSQV